MEKSELKKAARVWKRNEVESPCVSICLVHPTEKLCTGCFRTIEEISRWSKMSREQRQEIIAELPGRAPKITKRRGGRSAKMAQKSRDL